MQSGRKRPLEMLRFTQHEKPGISKEVEIPLIIQFREVKALEWLFNVLLEIMIPRQLKV